MLVLFLKYSACILFIENFTRNEKNEKESTAAAGTSLLLEQK